MIRTSSSLRQDWFRFVNKIAQVCLGMCRRTADKLNWVPANYVTFGLDNRIGGHVVIRRLASVTNFTKRPIYG